ncbi:hypothetical protein T492DRAFT_595653, partial [Pavlovales sp. CCMP2436]
YVCTYVRMYVCTYVRMYVCTYVRMYVCTYVRMYIPQRTILKSNSDFFYRKITCCASCPSVTRLSEAVSARARPIPPSLSPSFPPSGLCAAVGRSGKVIRGVAGFWLATIRISRMRGMPSVTCFNILIFV